VIYTEPTDGWYYISAQRLSGTPYALEQHIHAGDILPPVCVYKSGDANSLAVCTELKYKTPAAHFGGAGVTSPAGRVQ